MVTRVLSDRVQTRKLYNIGKRVFKYVTERYYIWVWFFNNFFIVCFQSIIDDYLLYYLFILYESTSYIFSWIAQLVFTMTYFYFMLHLDQKLKKNFFQPFRRLFTLLRIFLNDGFTEARCTILRTLIKYNTKIVILKTIVLPNLIISAELIWELNTPRTRCRVRRGATFYNSNLDPNRKVVNVGVLWISPADTTCSSSKLSGSTPGVA